MGKANLWFNSRDNRWEVRDKYGDAIAYFYSGGIVAPGKTGTLADLNIGTLATLRTAAIGGGTTITKIVKFSGTLTGITSVGTTAVAVGTVTGATVAVGDTVFGVPKADRSAGHVILGEFYVPTTNVVNVMLMNPRVDSAGSYPSTGVDMVAISN